jgi:RNA polymerase sigma-70 factor (ECF subfamily)
LTSFQTRQTLLIRVQSGSDDQAWEEFVASYRLFIFHVLHRMNIKGHDFDDLVQDTLIKLYEKLETYDPTKAKFRSWLSAVIRNLVLNHYRSKKLKNEKVQHVDDLELVTEKTGVQSLSEVDRLIEREWKMHISSLALEELKGHFSKNAIDVFKMSLDGCTGDEISTKLKISNASVKVLKSRVKSRYIEEVKRLIREFEDL